MSNQVYQIITDRILEIMRNSEKLVWVKNWKARAGSVPMNLESKRPYEGINYLCLASMPYAAPYWLTYQQAVKMGGNIKKGEKSFPVIFWKRSKYEATKPDGSSEEKTGLILRYYNVFNVEQTEGIDYKLPKAEPLNKNKEVKAAEKIVKAMPKPPEIKLSDYDRACYNRATDLVTMPKIGYFKNQSAYYATLFHELGHATGHKNRLNREELQHVFRFGDENYSKEELTAELCSAYVCAEIGLSNEDNLRNSAAYLHGWSKAIKNDPKMFVHASARAMKAANYILKKPQPDYSNQN